MKKIATLTLIAILLPMLVFAFLGCVKKPDHVPNFGKQVTFDDVQSAIKEAVVDFAPTEELLIKEGQFTYLEMVQNIDVQSPLLIMQRGDTVVDLGSDAQFNKLDFVIELNERTASGSMNFSRFPSCLRVEKPTGQFFTCPDEPPSPSSHQASSNEEIKEPIAMPDLSFVKILKNDLRPYEKITYHNLVKEYGTELYPDLVRQRPNCGGAANCETGMRYMKVQYDAILWDTEDHGIKTIMQYYFSPNVPTYIYDWANPGDIFPARIYRECVQQWVKVQNGDSTREVPVRQCRELKDFKFE